MPRRRTTTQPDPWNLADPPDLPTALQVINYQRKVLLDLQARLDYQDILISCLSRFQGLLPSSEREKVLSNLTSEANSSVGAVPRDCPPDGLPPVDPPLDAPAQDPPSAAPVIFLSDRRARHLT